MNITEASILIIDLDDTIYETRSIPSYLFDNTLRKLKSSLSSFAHSPPFEIIIKELWGQPIDEIASRHNIPEDIITAFHDDVKNIKIRRGDISPYDDYDFLKSINSKKILLTTGITEYQWSKIRALDISLDFEHIYVDDPRSNPRKGKKEIIQDIITNNSVYPTDVWVIGDNPNSELSAGHELGCVVVQRLSSSKPRYDLADLHINSFDGLSKHVSV